MWKRLFSWFFVLGFLFYSCSPVFAETVEEELAELKSRIAALEQKLATQEEKLGEQEDARDTLVKIKEAFDGLSIGAGATFVMQGTNNANGDDLSKNGEDVADASYSVDLEIEKKFDDYGLAFLHFEAGSGEGVGDELQLFSSVNADTTGDASKASTTRKPTPYTKKVTFYLKPDNAEKVKNFAYWDRHTETEAVNIIIEDGLKGKTTKPIPKDRR